MLVLFCDRVESIFRVAGENIRLFQVSIKRAEHCGGLVWRPGRMQLVWIQRGEIPKGGVF
jgi:hypothetical protein